jgi:hypothetical protein
MTELENINKTMDLDDLRSVEAKRIIGELNDLIILLRKANLNIGSWYSFFQLTGDKKSFEWINRGLDYKPLDEAVDDINFPWFLYWEIAWIVMHAGFEKGQKVLDLGGGSSLFSYYLASKGMDVTTVDLQEVLATNGNLVAEKMGWKLKNLAMDIRDLNVNMQYHHITSICVYEHIPLKDRVNINSRIKNYLYPGGRFSITFDYRNPSRFVRIDSPEDVQTQFVIPSDLMLRENQTFADNKKNYLYHPFFNKDLPWIYKYNHLKRREFSPLALILPPKDCSYTFGSLFLEKPQDR